MDVISLFDGCGCGRLALKRAGIQVDNYWASEIHKTAIRIAKHNHKDIKHIGDVRHIWGDRGVDLLIGGSPCQGFSIAGKQLNFNDPRSKLFFEFVRIKKEMAPKYWLLENVMMKPEYQDAISALLGVEPVVINSSLVSAQNRVRLYWANFPISQPQDKGIELSSVLEDLSYPNKATILGRRLDDRGCRQDGNKDIPFVPCLEVKQSKANKSNCLTRISKDNVLTNLPPGRYVDVYKNNIPYRNYTAKELCRLQTLPDDYFDDGKTSLNQVIEMTGNGWTVDVIAHIFTDMIKYHERSQNSSI